MASGWQAGMTSPVHGTPLWGSPSASSLIDINWHHNPNLGGAAIAAGALPGIGVFGAGAGIPGLQWTEEEAQRFWQWFTDTTNQLSINWAALEAAGNILIGSAPSHTWAQTHAATAEALGDIAKGFGQHKCVEAAKAMRDELTNRGHKKTMFAEIMFPVRERAETKVHSTSNLKFAYGGKTVSTNGYHVGVVFGGIVHCNIHPAGKPIPVWFTDFYSALPAKTKHITPYPSFRNIMG